MPPVKVCLLSSEIVPYAKTGGLADVVGALIPELERRGHQVRAIMPLYGSVRSRYPEVQPVDGLQDLGLKMGGQFYSFSIRFAAFPGTDAHVYFVDCPQMFDRPSLYTFDADEHRRFILLTRAAIECCRRTGFLPDIFHCNDWHTALLPLYLKTVYSADPALSQARSVLTIHNIGYQGLMPSSAREDLELGGYREFLDRDAGTGDSINPLRIGITLADVVTTVSPTYAREICDTDLGMGMQESLRRRRNGVIGILNGVDYREWDPRRDAHLTANFDAADIAGKAANKRHLLAAMNLHLEPYRPLLSMVTRLAEQKGIDLLFDALPPLLRERDFGFIVLGSGEERYVGFFADLARRYPGRVAFRNGYDEELAHRIEAGSDMFLMPSRYEPCGLNQMYSLRYGTIPIVRNTGGLADSVTHFDSATGQGTGCVFNDYDAPAVRWAVGVVLDWYADRGKWRRLIDNAMAQDFSWSRQAAYYEDVYRAALSASNSP